MFNKRLLVSVTLLAALVAPTLAASVYVGRGANANADSYFGGSLSAVSAPYTTSAAASPSSYSASASSFVPDAVVPSASDSAFESTTFPSGSYDATSSTDDTYDEDGAPTLYSALADKPDSAADLSTISATLGSVSTINVMNVMMSPDGFERPSTVANGVYPAPIILANKGDRFSLNVVNSLTDDTMYRATSIHWHGIYQHTTNWADGVGGVNQCPIAPLESFLYEFNVTNQAGTFWYHSHFRTQYCDGLRGALIIYDPQDPYLPFYDVDDQSTVITIGDWYHLQSPSITGIAANDATLINGKGRYPGGPLVDLAVVNVVPGKRYRFRIVGMSCDPNYMFSIDGHKLTIIEADGQYTDPLVVDQIQILAGQRYSVIVTADQPVDNYWIRALPNSGNNNLSTSFVDGTNSAIFRYAGAPILDPVTEALDLPVLLDETLLHPLSSIPSYSYDLVTGAAFIATAGTADSDAAFDPLTSLALTNSAISTSGVPGLPFPGGADVNINLDLSFDIPAWRFYVNNLTFNPPTVPVLLQILSGTVAAQDLLPSGMVYSIPRNSSVEISIPGGVIGSPHPFHLHGHSFSVVKSAGVDTPYNYVNPVKRDVVSIGDVGSNTTIRFFTDNAGPWFLHCHIDWHLDLGLSVVLTEDIPDVAATNPTPQSWNDLCPIYNSLDPSVTAIEVVPTPSVL